MSEKSAAEDRTQDPTTKRLEQARDAGQFPTSRDLNMLACLWGGLVGGGLAGPGQARRLAEQSAALIDRFATTRLGEESLWAALWGLLKPATAIVGCVALPAMACGIAAALAQTQFYVGGAPIKVQMSRMSPAAGLARILSAHNLMDFLKSCARIAVLCGLLWAVAGRIPVDTLGLLATDMARLLPITATEVETLVRPLMLAMAAFAAIDVTLVRLKHSRDMRMTREEVRLEMRDSEGDPMLKAKVRRIQTQRSRRRMMAKVRTADVVVTNPTHFAVALAYDRISGAAPVVVAKGADFLAARIKEEASRHNVPVVPNPPLARALYKVEIDAEIPGENFRETAAVIAYVWKLKSKMGAVA
jgi:flagellar biosynthetic protein FlhB